MDDHGQRIIDAVRTAQDMPDEAKNIAYSLTHMLTGLCNDIRRIADALEARPLVQPTPPRTMTERFWIRPKHDNRTFSSMPHAVRGRSAVRVQFMSMPDHVETHHPDDVDWSDVLAYQLINQE